MKILKNKKGQVAPSALEDIIPMAFMVIITLVFMVIVFKVVGDHLEERRAVDLHVSGTKLAHVFADRILVHDPNEPGLLDNSKLNTYSGSDYDTLKQQYGFIEYNFSVKVEDLRNNDVWEFGADPPDDKTRSVIPIPVAIWYDERDVHEGILSVTIWKS